MRSIIRCKANGKGMRNARVFSLVPLVLSEVMSIFEYSPLKTATTIRLVHLPRGDRNHDDAKIRLALHEDGLAKVNRGYCALSYVWGNSDCIHRITVNGQELYVTSTLTDMKSDKRSKKPGRRYDRRPEMRFDRRCRRSDKSPGIISGRRSDKE